MAVRSSDRVTLTVLPAPTAVRMWYLKQAAALPAPAKPTTLTPPAGWVATEPVYTEGSTDTLYTTLQVLYGTLGVVEYGDVQKSSTFEAAKAAYNQALNAQSVAASASPFIVGTQPGGTPNGAWLGVAPFAALTDGQQITYWLPNSGSGDASLNLTLSGGGTTGALPCYWRGTSRLTTHYPAGSAIRFTYRVTPTVGGSVAPSGWWSDASYDSGNTTDRTQYTQTCLAKSAITNGALVAGDISGFANIASGTVFDLTQPILWASAAVGSGANFTNGYLKYPAVNPTITKTGFAAPIRSTVYLKGSLNGTSFTVHPDILTAAPADDGYYYLTLGQMIVANTQLYLWETHDILRYNNGALMTLAQIAVGRAAVFSTTPTGPYKLGDLWQDGAGLLKVCTTARTTGFDPGDWSLQKVTAEMLEADLAVLSTIRIVDSNGADQTVLSGDHTVIRGDADLGNVNIYGLVKMALAELAVGGILTLQTGLTAPAAAPTLRNSSPTVTLRDSAAAALTNVVAVGRLSDGKWVAARRNPPGGGGSRLLSVHNSDGTWVRQTTISGAFSGWTWGMTVVNDRAVFTEYTGDTAGWNLYQLVAYNTTTWAKTTYSGGTGQQWRHREGAQGPPISWDNGSRAIVTDLTSDALYVHTFTWTGDAFTTTVTTKTITGLTYPPLARHNFDLGVDSVFAASIGPDCCAYTFSTGARAPAADFPAPAVSAVGMGYHAGVIWMALGAGIAQYDGPTWSGASSRTVYAAYTLYDSVGTPHETGISPTASFEAAKRHRWQLTGPALTTPAGVDDVDGIRVYAGTSPATLYRQGNTTGGSHVYSSAALTLTGTTWSPANKAADFPNQTPAEIRSANGAISLKADGTGQIPAALLSGPCVRAYIATDQNIAAGTNNVTGWSIEYGSGFNGGTGKYTVPENGLYMICLNIAFPTISSRRCIQVMRGAETIATEESVASGYSRMSAYSERWLTAGDILDVQVYTGSATQVRGTIQCEFIARRVR